MSLHKPANEIGLIAQPENHTNMFKSLQVNVCFYKIVKLTNDSHWTRLPL